MKYSNAVQLVGDSEEEPDCATTNGDEDDDGFVETNFDGTDCNDATHWIGPHINEICGDEVDNNCDGLTDSDELNA